MRYYFFPLTLILALVGAFNLWIDPTGAHLGTQGLPIPHGYVFLGNNINERLLKKEMLRLDKQSSTFILGSSRVLLGWNSKLFPKSDDVLNLGVTSATCEDYHYFLDQLAQRENVKNVYIEIAPWTFHKAANWDQSNLYYRKKGVKERWSEFKDLFTFSILRESYYTMVRHQGVGNLVPESEAAELYGYTADGRRHLTQGYLALDANAALAEAMKQANTPEVYDLNAGVDDSKIREFCENVERIQTRTKAKVRLMVLPWNPAAAQRVVERKLAQTVEGANRELIEKVQTACRMPVINFQNLCPAHEFFDAEHAREACFVRIMSELKNTNYL